MKRQALEVIEEFMDWLNDELEYLSTDDWRDILARQSPAVLPDVSHGHATETVRHVGVPTVRPGV